jgi:NAD(P)H-dependent FMN reductase
MAHTIVVIVGSLRKESFTLKIANALFQSGSGSRTAGRLGGIS